MIIIQIAGFWSVEGRASIINRFNGLGMKIIIGNSSFVSFIIKTINAEKFDNFRISFT